jgi:RimJ/RimL family protein N-acetyltransferase
VTEEILPEMEASALEAPAIFRHIPYSMETQADVHRVFSTAMAINQTGKGGYFANRLRSSGKVIGGTGIRVVDPGVPSVEIGMTWILPQWQRTRVNTEAKFLQLSYCFEEAGVERVEFKTDALNARSRAAIARLGAREEGTMRSHMRRENGTLRDSVYFAITLPEWPLVKTRLESMLAGEDITCWGSLPCPSRRLTAPQRFR